jgi:hypothetical protein
MFMSVFQIELNDYPHFDLAKDGRLCSTGQHCPGFPRVLYDAFTVLATTGTLRSTVANCPQPTAWISARLA